MNFRTAEEVAVPAFIASRRAAAPGVRQIFARLESAGLAPAGVLDAAFTERTANAVTALQDTFAEDAPERDTIADIINAGRDASEQWWHQVVLEQASSDVKRKKGRENFLQIEKVLNTKTVNLS